MSLNINRCLAFARLKEHFILEIGKHWFSTPVITIFNSAMMPSLEADNAATNGKNGKGKCIRRNCGSKREVVLNANRYRLFASVCPGGSPDRKSV